LLERYAQDLRDLRLPPYDDFTRYCVKMATGSGKTKVMALAVAWQFLNAMRESEPLARDYAKTFLVLAPNVIVFERLKTDFSGGRIFQADPVIPKELTIFWDFDCVMRRCRKSVRGRNALPDEHPTNL
jgi:type III restriction enzyme